MNEINPIYVGQTRLNLDEHEISGEFINILGDKYYEIANYDQMQPFFMSLVSSADHWFFISSTGGLSAGRVSPEQALFPYYTEDKITENSENTGSKTLILIQRESLTSLWEPFSIRQQGQYDIRRNIYKNVTGTALMFEEENCDLELVYRYAWRTGDQFGFIKTSWLENAGGYCHLSVLDGIQNILPAYTTVQVQNSSSVLLDAYKRNELDEGSGLGLFTLNATLTDLPEPSESLLATTVFQVGLENPNILLTSAQVNAFRRGQRITSELETRGKRGAYFVKADLKLNSQSELSWHIVADVSQDCAQIIKIKNLLQRSQIDLEKEIETDIRKNDTDLREIVARADGLQLSAEMPTTTHHFANVMFNVMRGGIFYDQYCIDKRNFLDYITWRNQHLLEEQRGFFSKFPERFHISDLHARAALQGNADLIRLSYGYLPLFFSRRHGDPSRPWNLFSINIKNRDGSDRLDYQGNWRDIFQNWEALAWSYPEFVESMIFTFLCATTADGYNPYRITLEGIDWEVLDPNNPWSNIGYWNDHQIIYLLKLMEISTKVHPGALTDKLNQAVFSFANIPYRIKPYQDLIEDPYHTIQFDAGLENEIQAEVALSGTDAKLMHDHSGNVLHRSLIEKLINLLLAKLVNFVPGGGIWMNTQRPEWNDANNALVGKGLSVVTLGYLYRFNSFFKELIKDQASSGFEISEELAILYFEIESILNQYQDSLQGHFSDSQRFEIFTALGKAGSKYREVVYNHGFSGELSTIAGTDILGFLELVQQYLSNTLAANRREDNLFHTYNVIQFAEQSLGIKHLDIMLEGQVSILSSGFLSAKEALNLLESLQKSPLYRPDQKSFILYPDKTLPSFLAKNFIPNEMISELNLPAMLAKINETSLLVQDETGLFHFSGTIHNERDVRRALNDLQKIPKLQNVVDQEGIKIAEIFEGIFKHSEFTGRSSTFFAYEGLGSIYWHMVSKLLLAVSEIVLSCKNLDLAQEVLKKYRDIQSGLGYKKTPEEFGAFPSDPYSHTPKGQGARQPGMTGLVKEEIIARQGELGLIVDGGCITFNPLMIDENELLTETMNFEYIDMMGDEKKIALPEGWLAYTFCQTPILMHAGDSNKLEVHYNDGKILQVLGCRLEEEISRHIFQRDGEIEKVVVHFSR